MESKWSKVKMVLGTRMCLSFPKTLDEDDSPASSMPPERLSDAVLLSQTVSHRSSDSRHLDMPTTPVPSSSGLRLPKHSNKASKRTCAICLHSMKPGHGHAIFTAECSHSFHFQCITSNVKHGNHMCPVCRANWKDIPVQSSAIDVTTTHVRSRTLSQDDPWMSVARTLPPTVFTNRRNNLSNRDVVQPSIFNDDEIVDYELPEIIENNNSSLNGGAAVEVKAFTEFSAISKSDSRSNFTVLINVKAPRTRTGLENQDKKTGQLCRAAPVDLVTVLDVSGSMAGTKLALLKRAMGFVITNLGPSDRLSVIAFSSSARRLFPLRKMNDTGKKEALQAVNSLTAYGGTNILEALKIGAKVTSERKSKNPVSSMILLSDGQDTYSGDTNRSLLPVSMHRDHGSLGPHIPVHAFGFGIDHDSVSMHSISETSGGTFSFIEAEANIQDAFAQCIGGLLSVVVQDFVIHVECVDPTLRITSMKTGSYKNSLNSNEKIGVITVGDLYAEEERDFLVIIDVPSDESSDETSLLTIKCNYKDPFSKDLMTVNQCVDAKIQRPEKTEPSLVVSMEVDRQLNRLNTTESMSLAKAEAENGDLVAAVSILNDCRNKLSESVSLKAGDRLSVALDAELKEMQVRMANQQIYETTGRAYVLSGLSSHSWQRATARGDSTESTSMVHAYQTPSMVDMVNRSQIMSSNIGNPIPQGSFRPPRRSFLAPPQSR